MNDLSIEELHNKLINKEITCNELIKDSLSKAHEIQNKCNAFVTIIDDVKETTINENLLSGIPFGIKDNYSTKGILSTGSSNTLNNYIPVFNATAVEKLYESGAITIGKTVLDEFGMGGTGKTGHTGIVKNPWDTNRICGGSSSGSAAIVASGVVTYALGSDTGDSIRKPAAYCGVVGYKPTYGMISRFGLFPYASSMDHCGVLTRSVKDAAIVVDTMKGIDKKDQTTWDSSSINLYKCITGNIKDKKLFYIKEITDINNYPNANPILKKHLDNYYKTIELLKKDGIQIDEVSFDKNILEVIPSVYMCIANAEATSNLSNLTGLIFGPRGKGNNINEVMMDYRTNGFSPFVKRRLVIGSYVLQKENQERYFINACRVRKLIVDKFKSLFKEYDALILPVGSGIAPLIEDAKDEIQDSETTILDNHLDIANFGGFPSITIPNGFIDNMPVGINITGDCYKDEVVLNIAYALENKMNYKGMIVGEAHE